jgi:hypothetical protein
MPPPRTLLWSYPDPNKPLTWPSSGPGHSRELHRSPSQHLPWHLQSPLTAQTRPAWLQGGAPSFSHHGQTHAAVGGPIVHGPVGEIPAHHKPLYWPNAQSGPQTPFTQHPRQEAPTTLLPGPSHLPVEPAAPLLSHLHTAAILRAAPASNPFPRLLSLSLLHSSQELEQARSNDSTPHVASQAEPCATCEPLPAWRGNTNSDRVQLWGACWSFCLPVVAKKSFDERP